MHGLTQHWVRCNQDELKKRAIVQRHAMNALQEGKNVLIDRTNIDYRQRAEWLELANEFRAAHPDGPRLVTCLVWVDTPIDVCKKRLAARTGHPTIKDAQSAMRCVASLTQHPRHVPADVCAPYAR